jgi:YHS domain-containing protein
MSHISKSKISKSTLLAFLLIISFASHLPAKDAIFNKDGIAILGYDPVSYFTEKKAKLGDKKFKFLWKGSTWLFSSQEHLELFKKTPEIYAPKYGGYCAYGLSKGQFAKVDPTSWKVIDHKLYLNYNHKINQRWANQLSKNIKKGDQHWLNLKGEFK